ncbi:leucine-rich repeat isoform f [Anaeramoeba flamelloides]|uniref:Leucine-rich repeat isoform f n=1 Tax=Anaeramoeba flamelloides TaxID=1746091 RepID=A0AAV8ACQ1_9EUKA|nr:leucine-rich repeat isoform f [Anaeramoeba flamelloides]
MESDLLGLFTAQLDSQKKSTDCSIYIYPYRVQIYTSNKRNIRLKKPTHSFNFFEIIEIDSPDSLRHSYILPQSQIDVNCTKTNQILSIIKTQIDCLTQTFPKDKIPIFSIRPEKRADKLLIQMSEIKKQAKQKNNRIKEEEELGKGYLLLYRSYCDYFQLKPCTNFVLWMKQRLKIGFNKSRFFPLTEFHDIELDQKSPYFLDLRPVFSALKYSKWINKLCFSNLRRREIIPLMTEVILSNQALTELHLDGIQQSDGLNKLVGAIGKNPNLPLNTLDLSNNPLGDKGVRKLINSLNCSKIKIRDLRLANCQITNKGIVKLFTTLKAFQSLSTSLAKIDLSSNNFGSTGSEAFSNWLEDLSKNQNNLSYLKLSNCSLDVQEIFKILHEKFSTKIEYLDVSNSVFDTKSGILLSKLISHSFLLYYLNISSTNISIACFRSVIHSINLNKKLDNLYLNASLNNFGIEGATIIADKLLTINKIKTLVIDENNFTAKGMKIIIKQLVQNKSIKEISFARNVRIHENIQSLTDPFRQLIEENKKIEKINISGGIKHYSLNGSLNSMLNSLKTNTTLKSLNIKFNGIGDDGFINLSKSLKKNETLTSLKIDEVGNNFTIHGLKLLSKIITKNNHLSDFPLPENMIKKLTKKKSNVELLEEMIQTINYVIERNKNRKISKNLKDLEHKYQKFKKFNKLQKNSTNSNTNQNNNNNINININNIFNSNNNHNNENKTIDKIDNDINNNDNNNNNSKKNKNNDKEHMKLTKNSNTSHNLKKQLKITNFRINNDGVNHQKFEKSTFITNINDDSIKSNNNLHHKNLLFQKHKILTRSFSFTKNENDLLNFKKDSKLFQNKKSKSKLKNNDNPLDDDGDGDDGGGGGGDDDNSQSNNNSSSSSSNSNSNSVIGSNNNKKNSNNKAKKKIYSTSLGLKEINKEFLKLLKDNNGSEIEKHYIKKKFKLLSVEYQTGNTALHYACSFGNSKLLSFLLSQEGSSKLINLHNKMGLTSLHLLMTKQPNQESIILLSDYGVDFNATDKRGWNPMQFLIHSSINENFGLGLLLLLLENGSDPNQPDNKGCTSLHRASVIGFAEGLNLLLQRGGNVDYIDKSDSTPLHKAARNGMHRCVKLLLKHDAQIDALDSGGNTPLSLARIFGQSKVEKILDPKMQSEFDVVWAHDEYFYSRNQNFKENDNSYLEYTILILGALKCGKTKLVQRMSTRIFSDTYLPTIENQSKLKVIVHGKRIVIKVVDVSGDPIYSTFRSGWVKQADGIILCYSITDPPQVLEELQRYYINIRSIKGSNNFPLLLVSLKNELTVKNISENQGSNLAEKFNCDFLSVSAKANLNVDLVFTKIILQISQKITDREPTTGDEFVKEKTKKKKEGIIKKIRKLSGSWGKSSQTVVVNSVTTIKIHFEQILFDQTCLDWFNKFLQKEYAEENLMFYYAVKAFKKIDENSQTLLETSAQKIFSDYVSTTSDYQINIEHSIRKNITNKIKNQEYFQSDLFDDALIVIIEMLKTDSYPKFLKSDFYPKMVSHLIDLKKI